MKKKLLTSFCALLVTFAHAQDYARVDATVHDYPKTFSTPERLAERIAADFTTDEDKVRAAFTWIATHITYDLKAYKEGSVIAFSYSSPEDKIKKEQLYRQKAAEKMLRTRKGVCQDFSSVFHTTCEAMGVKCIDIVGTSKIHPTQIGKLPEGNDHEWNAVKSNGAWKLVDVTWASGSVDTQSGKFVPDFNDGYFFTDPDRFALNHFPEDQRLLMTELTAREFGDLPLFFGNYIEAGFELQLPQNGTVSGRSIPFAIKGFKGGQLSYVVSSEGRVHDLDVDRNGDLTEFEVPLDGREGYLMLYWNRESLATFKIGRQ